MISAFIDLVKQGDPLCVAFAAMFLTALYFVHQVVLSTFMPDDSEMLQLIQKYDMGLYLRTVYPRLLLGLPFSLLLIARVAGLYAFCYVTAPLRHRVSDWLGKRTHDAFSRIKPLYDNDVNCHKEDFIHDLKQRMDAVFNPKPAGDDDEQEHELGSES